MNSDPHIGNACTDACVLLRLCKGKTAAQQYGLSQVPYHVGNTFLAYNDFAAGIRVLYAYTLEFPTLNER